MTRQQVDQSILTVIIITLTFTKISRTVLVKESHTSSSSTNASYEIEGLVSSRFIRLTVLVLGAVFQCEKVHDILATHTPDFSFCSGGCHRMNLASYKPRRSGGSSDMGDVYGAPFPHDGTSLSTDPAIEWMASRRFESTNRLCD